MRPLFVLAAALSCCLIVTTVHAVSRLEVQEPVNLVTSFPAGVPVRDSSAVTNSAVLCIIVKSNAICMDHSICPHSSVDPDTASPCSPSSSTSTALPVRTTSSCAIP